jgi:hypothetical protein
MLLTTDFFQGPYLRVDNYTLSPVGVEEIDNEVLMYLAGQMFTVIDFQRLGLKLVWDQGMYCQKSTNKNVT